MVSLPTVTLDCDDWTIRMWHSFLGFEPGKEMNNSIFAFALLPITLSGVDVGCFNKHLKSQ
jgi:hypothetical protein